MAIPSAPAPPASWPGWSSTPRGRKELLAVALFAALNVLVPLVVVDLYPFSRAPMFADAPRRYCDYHVYGPDGELLAPTEKRSLVDFGLERNYWGNPVGVGVGFRPPETVDRFGEVAGRDAVTEMVRRRMAAFPELEFVDVQQDVIADQDGNCVGVVGGQRWRIPNPAFKGHRGS
jgi:hypothetical protein